MDDIPVVTCFLRAYGRVLLLGRSEAVGSYRGQWGAVAGHVATDEAGPETPDRAPIDAARAEIREEAGFADATLVRQGDSFPVEDDDRGTRWLVHPFLFDVDEPEIGPKDHPTIDANDETAAFEWVHAPEIRRRETVPDLWESYDCVRPRAPTVREDNAHGAAYISVCALEVIRDEAALSADGQECDSDERDGNEWDALATLARELRDARPSMAVVANRVNRAMAEAAGKRTPEATDYWTPAAIESAATDGIDRAVRVDDEAASIAAATLPNRVATTSRSGTVRDALLAAEPEAILVAESRPGGEGVGVAESLVRTLPDVAVTLTSDAAFAAQLDSWDVSALLVGADRIRPDGSVVNKAGTRAAALAAPGDCRVLVVAATDKVATDDAVDIEPRDRTELYDGEAPIDVANPTFDVTPPDAIDAVVTERGVLSPDDVAAVADEHRANADW